MRDVSDPSTHINGVVTAHLLDFKVGADPSTRRRDRSDMWLVAMPLPDTCVGADSTFVESMSS